MLALLVTKWVLYDSRKLGFELKSLNYILAQNSIPITLDLHEAERYAPAVVVQQLIGNLVYYSNHGRYEPRLSEYWKRVSPTEWEFKVRDGFICENGEKITAGGFKRSITNSIRYAFNQGGAPVFNKLVGFEEFINGNKKEIEGIRVNGSVISFLFTEPTRSGPLQLLSFAPYGYICEENVNADFSWKDNTKFISSGPYRVKKFELGKETILVKRPEWPDFAENSPERINITHVQPQQSENISKPTIADSFIDLDNLPNDLKAYKLVPEYLLTIILGTLPGSFFSKIENRMALKWAIQKVRDDIKTPRYGLEPSSFFYPSQQKAKSLVEPSLDSLSVPSEPLLIEGVEPLPGKPRHYAYHILKAALDLLKWPYRFNNNEYSWKEAGNQKYDLRFLGPSIGAGVEAWSIEVTFFSPIGMNLPDPSGRVKKILQDYDSEKITEQELTDQFIAIVEEDSALLPIGHSGLKWYISPHIDTRSISPLISVIRFDQLELK